MMTLEQLMATGVKISRLTTTERDEMVLNQWMPEYCQQHNMTLDDIAGIPLVLLAEVYPGVALIQDHPGVALIQDHGPYAPVVKKIIPALRTQLPLVIDMYDDLLQFSKRYREAFFSPKLELVNMPQLHQRIYDPALDDGELGEAINDFSSIFQVHLAAAVKAEGAQDNFSYKSMSNINYYLMEVFTVGLLVDALAQHKKGAQLVRAYDHFYTKWVTS